MRAGVSPPAGSWSRYAAQGAAAQARRGASDDHVTACSCTNGHANARACRRGEWQDVKAPVVDFVLTRQGYVTEDVRIANLRRVTSLGVSLIGGGDVQPDGTFQLCISRIEAGYDHDRSSGNED